MRKEKTIKVIIGEKISPEESKKLDPAKRGVITVRKPPEADVAGQHQADADFSFTQCPWCGSMGWGEVHATHYTWLLCGVCGLPSRVHG